MRKRHVTAIVIVIAAIVTIVLLLSPAAVKKSAPPNNLAGPAEGGALETGAALDPGQGFRRLPASDVPKTVTEYPPTAAASSAPGQ